MENIPIFGWMLLASNKNTTKTTKSNYGNEQKTIALAQDEFYVNVLSVSVYVVHILSVNAL